MGQCTLRLANGLGAACDYEPDGENGGKLKLPSALYLPLRESDVGRLSINHGEQREVRITFGPEVGEASFVYVEES
ncbi:MAG TPA: hypothetical protein VGI77_11885 [Gaiellaceae bacterium]|jgi:hypothetical protein